MVYLSFSKFARELQVTLQPPNDDKDVIEVLLSWLTNKDTVTNKKGDTVEINPSFVSQIMNCKVNVPKAIKNECTVESILQETILHFENEIVPALNPFMSDDLYDNLKNIIINDSTISTKKKENLIKLLKDEKKAVFLAETFLYVINRDNKIPDRQIEHNDIPLLSEVGFECPICHSPLIEHKKGISVKKYSIVNIYPTNLTGFENEFDSIIPPKNINSPENKLALCGNHSEEYLLFPSIETYRKLYQLKEQLVASNKLRSDIHHTSLENEILDVIQSLFAFSEMDELVELPMSALRIDKKILPENHMLRADETTRVLKYYHFVNKLFSDLDRNGAKVFEHIASEIHIAYDKLDNGTQSQEQIVQQLSDWIRTKTQLGKEYIRACDIIVAFFIQNCEVFYEITE